MIASSELRRRKEEKRARGNEFSVNLLDHGRRVLQILRAAEQSLIHATRRNPTMEEMEKQMKG